MSAFRRSGPVLIMYGDCCLAHERHRSRRSGPTVLRSKDSNRSPPWIIYIGTLLKPVEEQLQLRSHEGPNPVGGRVPVKVAGPGMQHERPQVHISRHRFPRPPTQAIASPAPCTDPALSTGPPAAHASRRAPFAAPLGSTGRPGQGCGSACAWAGRRYCDLGLKPRCFSTFPTRSILAAPDKNSPPSRHRSAPALAAPRRRRSVRTCAARTTRTRVQSRGAAAARARASTRCCACGPLQRPQPRAAARRHKVRKCGAGWLGGCTWAAAVVRPLEATHAQVWRSAAHGLPTRACGRPHFKMCCAHVHMPLGAAIAIFAGLNGYAALRESESNRILNAVRRTSQLPNRRREDKLRI